MDNLTKTENIIDKIVENKLVILLIVFIFLFISIFLTALQKKEYSSYSQVLIIQEQGQQMDAYIAAKASESLAKNLKKAISTSSFRNKVLENSSDIELNKFQSEKRRRKEWIRTIDVKILPNSSILEIICYHTSAFQVEKLLNNVLKTLLENHQNYHGGRDNIRLEIINYPLTSINPTRPNWFLNLGLSLILAIFFIITLFILFPHKIQKINKYFKKGSKIKKVYKKVYSDEMIDKKIKEKKRNFNLNIQDYLSIKPENDYNRNDINRVNDRPNNKNNLDAVNNIIEESIREDIVGNDHYLKKRE